MSTTSSCSRVSREPGGTGAVVEQAGEVAAVGLPGQERVGGDGHPLRPAPAHQVLRVVLDRAHPAGVVVQQVVRVTGAVGQPGPDDGGPLDDGDVHVAAAVTGPAQQGGGGDDTGRAAPDDEHASRLAGMCTSAHKTTDSLD